MVDGESRRLPAARWQSQASRCSPARSEARPISNADKWSAAQYTAFEAERTRPVRDLVAAIPNRDAKTAIDLGCGPANSTEVLAAAFPGAVIIGLDNSSDMIASARKRMPDTRFDLADVTTWSDPGPFDVILSNAVMQWVPGHDTLFPRLVTKLAPGGSLAIQMPDNYDEPALCLMRETAARDLWADRLAKVARPERMGARWYYQLMKPLCGRLDIWRTIYFHEIAGGAAGVVEWFKGSALRPFLAALETSEQQDFLGRYQAEVAQAYPALANGSVLLAFPRLFIIATR
jgi:trans-aconitate 2-methyltransferase